MSQIKGKQIKDTSIVLDKLSGTGSVAFSSGAIMEFNSGSNLFYTDAPTLPTEVANKAYVDSIASGLDVKEAARVIAVDSITLSGTQPIDGVTVSVGDRVVVNGQNPATENGIYIVSVNAWTRATDMDQPSEVNGGEFIFIKEGNTYADTGWVVSTPDDVISIGNDDIIFTQFSSVGVISAGLGLAQNGNTFDIITGVGLTASVNELKLTDTAVTSGSYGGSSTVGTFVVDNQGRLTAASNISIDITASQVSDFNTTVSSEVFNSANFVDSNSIDFTVGTGDVTADVKADTTKGIDVGSNGVFVKVDNSTIDIDGSGNLRAIIPAAAVQGAQNGLELIGTDVYLGGTLSKDTTINGDANTFTLNNADTITFETTEQGANINLSTKSEESSVLVDSPTIGLTSSELNISFSNSSITDNSGGQGLVYSADYSSTFIDESLITKKYVDAGTASIWTAIDEITGSDIDEITAGNGLTGGGTQGTVNVAVGNGAGIKVNADSIEVEITTQGGLTFSGTGVTGTLQVAYDTNTLDIDANGRLTVVGVSAQPVYDFFTLSNSYVGVNNDGDVVSEIEITQTPNDYSRIQVYVNGQKQLLGAVTTTDCWFGDANVAEDLSDLVAGNTLVWNSESAGFKLEQGDRVEIVYEA